MEVSKAIELRRAVKAYDPNHRMSDAEIERLLSLAMLSPTAWNIQNWRFVVVRDPELRRQIRAVAWDQAQVTDASLLVVLTADLKAWQKAPERYWRNAEPEVRDWLVNAMTQFYEGRDWLQRDEAMRSCGLAAMTLMLAAQEMGYQTGPMDGFDFDAVARIINLPADHVISMFVVIGKGIRGPMPRGGQLALEEVLVRDRFD
ncbi:MAG: nitroreductase family protein [Candidatus Nitricoxidivorans perseverans]|uniref:Nitroreductase family protein n=1 Tax=Candidatus Nitricoxidivorans perseverans TaxID=2975601 RepID=A0AA49FM10_9PROT|nr:MAG: nitroreductase family protein [Candidatus Nitricoxidivorans perseverans]